MSSSELPRLVVLNRQRRIPLDLSSLRAFADRALAAVSSLPSMPEGGLSATEEISVALISDSAMARFHFKFMNLAGPTDVLTFEHGEILISTETAARHALEFDHTPQQEVALYILHGLLHLRGFNDTTPETHEQMHRVQNQLFAQLGAS